MISVGDTICGKRISRYHIEIRHEGGDWHEIHPPAWEHTDRLTIARPYADAVRADYPQAEIRIMQTDGMDILTYRTGATSWMPLADSKVQTYL